MQDAPGTIEEYINELRSEVSRLKGNKAQELEDLEEKIKKLERMSVAKAGEAESKSQRGAARAKVLAALAKADKGKPGYLSRAHIEQKLGLTHSEANNAIKALNRDGEVWERVTWGENGRKCHYVYHIKAVRP